MNAIVFHRFVFGLWIYFVYEWKNLYNIRVFNFKTFHEEKKELKDHLGCKSQVVIIKWKNHLKEDIKNQLVCFHCVKWWNASQRWWPQIADRIGNKTNSHHQNFTHRIFRRIILQKMRCIAMVFAMMSIWCIHIWMKLIDYSWTSAVFDGSECFSLIKIHTDGLKLSGFLSKLSHSLE